MDADQTARRLMRETLRRDDADYYEFEAHVFFDDSIEVLEDFEEDGPGKIPNQFVRQFVSIIDQVGTCD
jgi:chitin synthase